MRSNRLQLNAEKNEVMWCASVCRQSQLPRCPITVSGASVEPVSVVRDLGVYIDSDLGDATHVRSASICGEDWGGQTPFFDPPFLLRLPSPPLPLSSP